MKNWEPFVLGPELAIDSAPATWVCLVNSSANFVVCVSPRLLHSYALYLGLPVPAVEEVDESS